MKIYNVIQKIDGLGNGDFDYEAVYESGYSAGYGSGYTDAYEECRPDYNKEYLTFEILSSGTINWCLNRPNSAASKTIFYSLNGGNWTELTSTYEGASFNVSSGDIVMFKGENETYSYNDWRNIQSLFYGSTAVFNIYGNIMSLIYGDDFIEKYTITDVWNFYAMFGRTNAVDASNLVLPATACTNYSYANMFSNCTSLVYAPSVLPATTLANYCYNEMFAGCTSLITAPELPATTMQRSCYADMFNSCASLVSSPILPATGLAQNCYSSMFLNCTALTSITCLATEVSDYYTGNWVYLVPQDGTFYKHPDAEWERGASGIPEGWTVVDAEI